MQIVRWIRQLCCRHEDILRMEATRMRLECLACGRMTHGFDGLGRTTHAAHREPAARAQEWARPLHRAA